MLELHKLIIVSHKVLCLIVFILFDEQSLQKGVFKVIKNGNPLLFSVV